MPYIAQTDKNKWRKSNIDEVCNEIETCGELNYIFTLIAHIYIKRKGLLIR